MQTVGSFRPFLQEREREREREGGRERGKSDGSDRNSRWESVRVYWQVDGDGGMARSGGGGRGELRWLGWTPDQSQPGTRMDNWRRSTATAAEG